MDSLGIIFGSEARVKIIRLFLFNLETVFDLETIASKSKVSKNNTKKEVSILERANLIKRKSFVKIIERKNKKPKKIKTFGYHLNKDFSYVTGLKQLLIKTKMLEGGEIIKRLSRSGRLKMVVVAGVFTQDKDSRADMLIVGTGMSKSSLTNAIKSIEAEVGRELIYVYFEKEDFEYRLGMNDRLIRDILDYPHQLLLDKINL